LRNMIFSCGIEIPPRIRYNKTKGTEEKP